MSEYIPPSVRYGNRRRRLHWRYLGWREALAFRLAPWLRTLERHQSRHLSLRDYVMVPVSRSLLTQAKGKWTGPLNARIDEYEKGFAEIQFQTIVKEDH